MNQIKAMVVFGTRPEAIKVAPLIKELQRAPEIETLVCVTAQHRQMLDQVMRLFDLTPDYDLDIMRDRQSLADITLRAVTGLMDVFAEARPDLVLVHGDTTTTFAAALAAFYSHITVGHIEAGLRTHNIYSPYPEEMNRLLTGVIAQMHFPPTETNAQNLLREGKDAARIYVTGNTVIDALALTVKQDYSFTSPQLRQQDWNKRVVIMTAHRRENLGEPLENICRAARRLVHDHADLELIYPMHLNPAVRETAMSILGDCPSIKLIDPLGVEDLHNAIARAHLILTDSGGIQEEAPSLGKPVLVLRTETERPEAVVAGTVKIVGVDEDEIYRQADILLGDPDKYNKMAMAINPYGDGKASKRITEAILYEFGRRETPPKPFIPR